jgi:hypothetical protein
MVHPTHGGWYGSGSPVANWKGGAVDSFDYQLLSSGLNIVEMKIKLIAVCVVTRMFLLLLRIL